MKHLDCGHFFLGPPLGTVLIPRRNERTEQRMRLERFGFELGMELAADEEGVPRNLDDLNIGAVRCGAAQAQASAGEKSFVLAIEFVAMTMALADFCSAVVDL